MADSPVMFGLKTVARYLDISVAKVKQEFSRGMPHERDEQGTYVTYKTLVDEYFRKRIEKGIKKGGKA